MTIIHRVSFGFDSSPRRRCCNNSVGISSVPRRPVLAEKPIRLLKRPLEATVGTEICGSACAGIATRNLWNSRRRLTCGSPKRKTPPFTAADCCGCEPAQCQFKSGTEIAGGVNSDFASLNPDWRCGSPQVFAQIRQAGTISRPVAIQAAASYMPFEGFLAGSIRGDGKRKTLIPPLE